MTVLFAALRFFSSRSAALGAPLANHLWQSTLFAAIAALLTLVLRNNRAQTRCWLWLIASAKFLLPFSLLIVFGNYLGLMKGPAVSQTKLAWVMQEISQPFASTYPAAAQASAAHTIGNLLLTFSFIVWFSGFIAVLSLWCLRWRRVVAVVRRSLPGNCGRELEMLRRLLRNAGMAKPVKLMISDSALEPGLVGVFRPAILLPRGITERLSDAQMEAVITHELCHLRRRDNLAAAMHMVVEAVFWFHPLVWWMGAHMMNERERACDEEVLRQGSKPQVYAEAILKVCSFYLESPLVCVAGISGSNLKKRIEEIMLHRTPCNLQSGKKFLLAAMAALAAIAPVVFGLMNPRAGAAQSPANNPAATTPAFELASITANKTGAPVPPFKIVSNPPGTGFGFRFAADGFRATNVTLHQLLRVAYSLQDAQVVGGPDWFDSERFDVQTRLSNSLADELGQRGEDQQRLTLRNMVQALLADRFKLTIHRETRDLPIYVLVLAKSGSKLQEAKPGDRYANGLKRGDGQPQGPGLWSPQATQLVGQGVPLANLVRLLSNQLGRPVLDQTGLTGNYDFNLEWTPTSLLTAVPEQLGLELNAQTSPIQVLVVDHAERIGGEF